MKIPVFPLPVYLLPGGVTRLRIFEQRYLNMVKNAHLTDGFVIGLYRPQQSPCVGEWGSWVEICDFQLGSDNLLVIDVKCRSLVHLSQFERNLDNLLLATMAKIDHWPPISAGTHVKIFAEQLRKLFSQTDELSQLYKTTYFDQPNWVCARWLELFPISVEEKDHFAKSSSADDVVDFLSSVIIEQKNIENLS
ncbi:hypothetical protein QWY77_04025 [Thalassotalea ponticola]|uniref:LON peptidase substrate-binding domain-containing protein n=1 Tax=Thalassotalea ponticola TaxID=1523392 RepID=UPI0025B3BFF0|nr:LON peptidase substrate-binding domain-containing protein [Thalassotalea ponticola]MDN3651934.1 hypothetical protein [Thalassotalea ponticola]